MSQAKKTAAKKNAPAKKAAPVKKGVAPKKGAAPSKSAKAAPKKSAPAAKAAKKGGASAKGTVTRPMPVKSASVKKGAAPAKGSSAKGAKKGDKKFAPAKGAPAKGASSKFAKGSSSAKSAIGPKRTTGPGVGVSKKSVKKGEKKARDLRKVVGPVDPQQTRRDEAKKLAIALVLAGLEKKAERVEIIDVTERIDYTDFIVLMSGRSDRQVGAIAAGIETALKERGGRASGVDGARQGAWICLDCGDVWVHVFLEEARRYYDIEGLWMDAPRVPVPADVMPRLSAPPPPMNYEE